MYETGLLVAFLLWAAHMVHLIVSINSKMERNLNKLGRRLSWVTLDPKPMDADDQNRQWGQHGVKFVFIACISLPFVIVSWLYVAFVIGQFLYARHKDSGVPQIVKEYRWKLKNCDMTFDQLVREGMKVAELDPNLFEQTRTETIQLLKDRGLNWAGHELGRST